VNWLGMGLLPFLLLAGMAAALLGALALVVALLRGQWRKAREAGYPSMWAYLRAAPQTDEEKRDAADLALKGLVICLLGLLFPPLLLIGLFPFFYGARKVVYASMGLGLLDDGDSQPQRPPRGA
jgi:hypothetical protein